MEKLVKRSGKVAFMDVSTTSIANFLRMTKFTEISKSKNPTEYSRTYVDQDGELERCYRLFRGNLTYPILYQGNLVHQKLVDITDNEKTGNDALVKILQVDFSKPIDDGYEARLRTYSTVPDTEGDSTDTYTYSGAFRKNSGFTIGKAVVSKDGKTATFTPKKEVAEYPVTFVVKNSSGTPVERAKITIENESILTDVTGIATVDLQVKSYSNIKIEKEGYTTQDDVSVIVSTSAILKEITLAEA